MDKTKGLVQSSMIVLEFNMKASKLDKKVPKLDKKHQKKGTSAKILCILQ